MTKIPQVKWIEEALTVHDLVESRVAFNPSREPPISLVPYHVIDRPGGLHNRAREHSSLDDDLWMDYALKMDAGHPFKAITLYQVNDGVFQYGVAHGNHRLRAFAFFHNDDTKILRSPKALVGAYIIESAYNDDIEEYERLANSREGKRQSQEYALNNAIWLVQNRNMSLKRAEQRTGISADHISGCIKADETRARAERLGIDTNNLTRAHLTRMSSLKHDSHLKHLATIANDANLSSGDTSKMVTELNRLRTEAKGNDYLHNEYNRTRRERSGPRNNSEPPELRRRRLFLKGFRQFEDLWLKGNEGHPIHSLSDVGIDPQDRQVRAEMAGRAKDLIKLMQQAMRLKEGAAA